MGRNHLQWRVGNARCNALVKKVKALPGCNPVVRIDQEVAAV